MWWMSTLHYITMAQLSQYVKIYFDRSSDRSLSILYAESAEEDQNEAHQRVLEKRKNYMKHQLGRRSELGDSAKENCYRVAKRCVQTVDEKQTCVAGKLKIIQYFLLFD